MNKYNLSLLVLSCDKNHDLYKWINRTCDQFVELGIESVLVTESNTKDFSKSIQTLPFGNGGFDERFVFGLKKCKSEYVLVLLDDYFVHDDSLETKLDNWLSAIKNENLTALRISKNKKLYVKKEKRDTYSLLKDIKAYEIDFHPTIWNKNELLNLIEGRSFTPWTLEPLFSLYLKDKKAAITRNPIDYDELIIQGCFFTKPFVKYCKDEYEGNKKVISKKKYLSYLFKTWIFNVSPYWLIKILRKLFKKDSLSGKAKL